MKAVHFGAGNIGRGFIGYLQYKSGYDVTFVDISDFLVDAINKYKNYTVITLSTSENKEEVKNVSAIHLKDIKALEIAVSEADLITTSIGANNLASTGNVLRDLLEKRVQVNKKELDIIACENALFATDILKRSIFDGASIELTEYLQEKVGFPNSAVDRIVPNVNIEKELPIDVAVEDFYEWDIEKDKIKINSEIKGAEYVDKLGPYLERKLFLLNGAHATIAYLGYIKNYKFIHEAVTMDEVIRNAAIGFHNEGIKALSVKHGISVEELKNYSKKIIGRFENSYLQDELSRVGRDPVRKLSANDRLVTPLKLCYELGLEANNILTGIAAGFLFDFEDDEKAQGIQNNIRTNGIVKTVSDVTGLSQDDEVITDIVRKYEELKVCYLK
ncbi:mannitol-1-phosphate 5-dehydrogenase [Clostridium cellulovorans]|uniref:Mannitol-1-phosphate 5-dehydrogenase n=1 Tax=Clostridium cellulovorans (strain ATCC 35296 / DSM 3052 / OCM 3 / 743B) TaxID=573061 RepID=D9SPY5_CLOC7|nr:mannitol-1-phosphate 5-dehydrogenase [Clostridium cellulovorans]ADL52121.1 Mannitol dehydrogenase domain [Clostridium cellulovorans 743B]